MKKRSLIAAVFAVFLFLASSFPLSAGTEVYIKVWGRGFGHGVGMCQWGANGLAKDGKNYKEIISYYFKGVSVSKYSSAVPTVRVLLKEISSGYLEIKGTPSLTIVNKASNETVISNFTDRIRLEIPSPETSSSGISVKKYQNGAWQQVEVYTGPLEITVPSSSDSYLSFYEDKEYRYKGFFLAVYDTNKKTIRLINHVDLETYVYGIAEMPSSWNQEALKAQAVSARTYAYYAYLRKGSSGDYDLFDDQNSQVYIGLNKINEPNYGTNWKNACDATNKEIVFYNGSPAHIYYHSTCGGHTENSEDVWLNAYPELRGVECNYCSSSTSYQWETTITLSQLRQKFGDNSIVYAQVIERIQNRRVKTVRLYRSDGSYIDVSGSTFRSKFGLKSTWFYLSAERIAGADRYETNVSASQKVFSNSSAVVIVNSDAFIDAIVSVPLAGRLSAPILLTKKDGLPYVVQQEILRLKPSKCYIIGGTGVISSSVEARLKQIISPSAVKRLGGLNRFETCSLVASEIKNLGTNTSTVALVNSESIADAMSVSPLSYKRAFPIILTEKDRLRKETSITFSALKPAEMIIVGGTGIISDKVVQTIDEKFNLSKFERWAGRDRFETSYIVSRNSLSKGITTEGCALIGNNRYADGLSASFLCGKLSIPLLIVRPDASTYWAKKFVQEFNPINRYVVGGPSAVSYDSEFYCFSY